MSNNQLYQLIIFVCLSIYSSLSLINETNVNKAVAKPSPKGTKLHKQQKKRALIYFLCSLW